MVWANHAISFPTSIHSSYPICSYPILSTKWALITNPNKIFNYKIQKDWYQTPMARMSTIILLSTLLMLLPPSAVDVLYMEGLVPFIQTTSIVDVNSSYAWLLSNHFIHKIPWALKGEKQRWRRPKLTKKESQCLSYRLWGRPCHLSIDLWAWWRWLLA